MSSASREYASTCALVLVRVDDCAGQLAARAGDEHLHRLSLLHGRARLAIDLALLDRVALVVRLLALGERQRQLDAPVLEIHPQRHERHAALDGLADQLPDFVAVQQQLSARIGG